MQYNIHDTKSCELPNYLNMSKKKSGVQGEQRKIIQQMYSRGANISEIVNTLLCSRKMIYNAALNHIRKYVTFNTFNTQASRPRKKKRHVKRIL